MKIGILTFHYALNYGAVMQMYALQKTLESLGASVEIIDYMPPDFTPNTLKNNLRVSGLKNGEPLSAAIRRIWLNLRYQKKLCDSFACFLRENCTLSPLYTDENWKQMLFAYDAVVVGSDQVWNPFSQESDVYFLNGESSAMKIAYAADSTNDSVKDENRERLRLALSQFSALSVRNAHSARFVQRVTGQEPPVMPDPVILHDFSDLSAQEPPVSGDYIFVYLLGKEIPGSHEAALQDIRERYPGMPVVQAVMLKQNRFTVLAGAEKKLYSCSPESWLSLIRRARFVYTDSFHCILFALKFHIPFLSYYADALRAPRLLALQEQYGLGACVVSGVEEMRAKNSLSYQPDFDRADAVFAEEKAKAVRFLQNGIKERFL